MQLEGISRRRRQGRVSPRPRGPQLWAKPWRSWLLVAHLHDSLFFLAFSASYLRAVTPFGISSTAHPELMAFRGRVGAGRQGAVADGDGDAQYERSATSPAASRGELELAPGEGTGFTCHGSMSS